MKESKTKSEACSLCGEVYDENELVEFEGKKVCPECLSRETIVCSHCGSGFGDCSYFSPNPFCCRYSLSVSRFFSALYIKPLIFNPQYHYSVSPE